MTDPLTVVIVAIKIMLPVSGGLALFVTGYIQTNRNIGILAMGAGIVVLGWVLWLFTNTAYLG